MAHTQVLIVGAGLAGLMAARTLQSAGISVIVLDKGQSVGGRLATRRIQSGFADHGAQFFTARTNTFQAQINEWIETGLVKVWGYGWSDGSVKRTVGDGYPRYIVQGGMNTLAKTLAADVTHVRVNTRVELVEYTSTQWQLTDQDGKLYTSQYLLLTPPTPQSLKLTEHLPLTAEDRKALEYIQYGPCLCAMFVIEGGDVDIPEPGALQDFTQPIYWMADNTRKGISPQTRIVTVHAEARYSRQHYDAPDETILSFLRAPLEARLTQGATITESHLKKWLYSVPITTHPKDYLFATNLPLVFAGDSFGGRGRVEGAYMSGLAAGNAILDHLSQSQDEERSS